MSPTIQQLRVFAVLAFAGGVSLIFLWLVRANLEGLHNALRSHAAEIRELATFLRLPLAPSRLLIAQGALFACALILMLLDAALWASLIFVPALLLKPILQTRRARRVSEIEAQLDNWLTGLAAALRATPALGDAIEYSIGLVADPLQGELDTLAKELRLGVPLEAALLRAGDRIGSHTVTTALGALRIGQRTGGDLSRILERSASTLREMARLEGVVRVKTAEGKAQASVLALLPFPVVALLNYLNPGFLAPLAQGPRGYAVIAASVVLWVSSLVAARRILHVDI